MAVPALSVCSRVTVGLGASPWSPLQGERVQADFFFRKLLTVHILTQQAGSAGAISSQLRVALMLVCGDRDRERGMYPSGREAPGGAVTWYDW